MKKYLKTIEDIEALRNTGTVIYNARCDLNYLRFIDGILCQFSKEGKLLRYNTNINVSGEYYIEVEDDTYESYIGKLGWVSDKSPDEKNMCSILTGIDELSGFPYSCSNGAGWKYFKPLTPDEVAEITGYKVEEEE